MRTSLVSLIFVAFFVSSIGTLQSKVLSTGGEDIQLSEAVVLSEHRPELGLDYSHRARFKLASRKTTYRLGEMLTLDTAMLNMSGRPAFFRKPQDSEFSAHDRKGNTVMVLPYVTPSTDVTRQSFSLLQPDEILTNSVQFLVGCDKRVSRDIVAASTARSDRMLFDRNLFVNQGYGCINVKQAGTYTLIAEESNEYVVVSSGRVRLLTIVGTIKSSPLTIRVMNQR